MTSLNPYLFFNGNRRDAMSFYKDCLNGEITNIQTYGEAPLEFPAALDARIFNSEPVSDQVRIMASDTPEDPGDSAANRFALFLILNDAEEIKRLSERLSEGGNISMTLDNGFCMLTDQFGIQWMLAKN